VPPAALRRCHTLPARTQRHTRMLVSSPLKHHATTPAARCRLTPLRYTRLPCAALAFRYRWWCERRAAHTGGCGSSPLPERAAHFPGRCFCCALYPARYRAAPPFHLACTSPSTHAICYTPCYRTRRSPRCGQDCATSCSSCARRTTHCSTALRCACGHFHLPMALGVCFADT